MDKQNRRIVIGVIGCAALIVALCFFISTEEKTIWPKGRIEADSGNRLVMGTFARVVAVAENSGIANSCIEAAFAEIQTVDELMSDYKSDSEISELNRDGFRREVEVSESTYEVLQRSIEFSKLTGGAFDITVGPLVDLLRSAEKKEVVPSEEEIAEAKLKAGYQKLKLDDQNRTVKFTVDGMKLDLGGIAKGYAIDRAVEAMQKGGAIGGMVDIGGDIRCFGAPPQGKNHWLIGLQDPSVGPDIIIPAQAGISTGELLLVLKLENAAIATSGSYRRFVLVGGKKYSHILDTRTGYGSDELASVTVISKNATDADALATAVSVMGAEKGLALIETIPETEAILISLGPEFERVETSGAEKYISR